MRLHSQGQGQPTLSHGPCAPLPALRRALFAAHRSFLHISQRDARHLLRRSSPPHQRPEPTSPAAAATRAALSLLASVCLSLGPSSPAQAFQLASVAEDALLQVVRGLEVGADSALGALRDAAALQAPAPSSDEQQAAQALVQEVWETVDSNFLDARGTGFDRAKWAAARERVLARPPRDLPAARTAARRLVAQLGDPYSRFLESTEFGAMIKYDVSGVGLNLGTAAELGRKTNIEVPEGRAPDGGGVWVVGLIRGLAASAAGIEQGDELVELGGLGLSGRTPFEVASLLSGGDGDGGAAGGLAAAEAAPLRLKVRKLSGDERTVALARPARDPLPSPVSALPGADGDAVVRLRAFTARAQRDVAAALRQLGAADGPSSSGPSSAPGASSGGGGPRRVVLDLRGNRGGLVSEGAEVARLFLGGDAPIVRTIGRAAAPPAAPAGGLPPLSAAPLAVLVDGHTASAAEIAAGALRDNCRAVLVGRGRTYGKGLIQSVYELSDGSGLVLTVGKYLTPAGIDIDREGLRPDFGSLPSQGEADAALEACRLRRGGGAAAGSAAASAY